jgi:hypothetical protein
MADPFQPINMQYFNSDYQLTITSLELLFVKNEK